MLVLRAAKLMFLMLRKEMSRDCLTLESVKLALNDINL